MHSLHYLVSAPAGMIMFYAKPKVLEERISVDKLAKLGAGLIQPLCRRDFEGLGPVSRTLQCRRYLSPLAQPYESR